MINIAIFASGNGTNAQRIIDYFKGNDEIKVVLILSNKTDAFVLKRAEQAGIPTRTFTPQILRDNAEILKYLDQFDVNFIVLAGFLLLMPTAIIQRFQNRIVNIHPALLPAYGGKGMYGDNVHKAVIANGETESGITIHYVNENYDDGAIIFQARCPVLKVDSSETLAARIHQLEYDHFPRIINDVIKRDCC
jgi:phosphoribosylglycinamide formyltransferase 1